MKVYRCLISALVVAFVSALAGSAKADEWEESTPYYEDDAWYDVSEWFDGNDYNPTDEQFGVWDDEQYHGNRNSSDQDNDAADASTANTYTSYDDDATSDQETSRYYRTVSTYYDLDKDGTYDAFGTWVDTDLDGTFDDVSLFVFNDSASEEQKQAAKQQPPKDSRRYDISGEVESVKTVKVGGKEHKIVQLDTDSGEVLVDVGSAKKLKEVELKKGQQLHVSGPRSELNGQALLLAHSMELEGKSITVDRNRSEIKGVVKTTKKAKVRGSEHLIAMISRDGKDSTVAVDFGPANELRDTLKEGNKVSFRGLPIKVNDAKLMFAVAVKRDGKWQTIDRFAPKNSEKPADNTTTSKS